MDTSVWCLMEAVSGQTGITVSYIQTHHSSLPEKEHN